MRVPISDIQAYLSSSAAPTQFPPVITRRSPSAQ